MGQVVWTMTLVLEVADFLCFVGQDGSEQECSQTPLIGYPVNKNLFPSPQIFMLCVYMVARGWTVGCPVIQLPLRIT